MLASYPYPEPLPAEWLWLTPRSRAPRRDRCPEARTRPASRRRTTRARTTRSVARADDPAPEPAQPRAGAM
jgi:hypothetical protein